MKRIFALFAFSAVAALAQTPTITAVLNNYGRIPASASNFGIAQGALFIVKGANLSAQADTTLQNPPLQTTLAAVRVRITSNGVVTYAPIYYVLSTQIAAVLPSTIALSNSATVIIEKNGVNSAPFAFKVVKSAYGQLSWEFETGTGRAIVVKLDGTLAGLNGTGTTNVLNPNEVIILYGSGLGPISTSDALAPTPTNMADVPITVNIGGVNAEVLYRGRSTFAALDQINVRIPALQSAQMPNGARAAEAYSCNVSMLISVGGVDANPTTLPIAASGTTCTNPNTGGGGPNSGVSTTPGEVNAWVAAGFYKTGAVGWGRATAINYDDTLATTVTKRDSFSADFYRISGADLGRFLRGEYPPGFAQFVPVLNQCIVYTTIPSDPFPLITRLSLDAGASVTSNGPNGTQIALKTVQTGIIQYIAPNVPNTYMAAGNYTGSGAGGPDVGAFSGGLQIQSELRVTDNQEAFKTITRSSGVTVHWTGGDPDAPVSISGNSFSFIAGTQVPGTPVVFLCYVPNTGSYTVPASVLNQLPPSPAISVGGSPITFRGSFSVSATNKGNRISIPGIDYATAAAQWSTAFTPKWQ